MAATSKLHMGELEAAVMNVLWDRGGWSTPGEVHEVLTGQRPLAYTTVMTILVRLWQKGRLRRERDGRAYAYAPVHTREQEVAARMSEVLVKAEDRSKALSFFLESLPSDDRAQLRRMLQDRKAKP